MNNDVIFPYIERMVKAENKVERVRFAYESLKEKYGKNESLTAVELRAYMYAMDMIFEEEK